MEEQEERKWIIKVPASSANIGPGFDVLGLALTRYLTMTVTHNPLKKSVQKCITLSYTGEGASGAPLDPYQNLITRVALYVLLCHGKTFPAGQVNISIDNQVPFGRGMGSSASAVIAGVLLGSGLGDLGLSQSRVKDFALMVERHPDNVTAALVGGFTGSFLRTLKEGELVPTSIPLEKVLPDYSNALPTVESAKDLPVPPINIGHHVKYPVNKDIGVIVAVPQFQVSTEKSRSALPANYSKADVIFNLQRLAVLTSALATSPPDGEIIWEAMRDKVHQPYREELVPGLTTLINTLTPATHPGLLGICLSGAGPTILALVSKHGLNTAEEVEARMASIGEAIKTTWNKDGIEVEWLAVQIDEGGASLYEVF